MKNIIYKITSGKAQKLTWIFILGFTLLCMSCSSFSQDDGFTNVASPDDVNADTDTDTDTDTDIDIVTEYSCSDPVQASGFNGGNGTEAVPYLICSYVQLGMMRDDLSAHYKLGQNIDASSSYSEGSEREASADGDSDCTAYDSEAAASTDAGHPEHGDSCTGWVFLGTTGNYFTGSLDGAGYAVQNIYQSILGNSFSQNSHYAGFFGRTGGQAEIRNLGIENANISLSISDPSGNTNTYSGGLVGYNTGTVRNSYATGSVSSSSSVLSSSSSSSILSRSYSGGLVGYNTGTVRNSYATGSASPSSSSVGTASSSNAYGGGLVGQNTGTIKNSYATGPVSSLSFSFTNSNSNSYGGGLVGLSGSGGTVENSYATGFISSSASNTAYAGGLLGRHNGYTRISRDSYWDTETSGQATSSSNDAVGLSTSQMQAVSGTYPSNLGSAFQLNDGEYPKLYKQGSTTELVPGQ